MAANATLIDTTAPTNHCQWMDGSCPALRSRFLPLTIGRPASTAMVARKPNLPNLLSPNIYLFGTGSKKMICYCR